MQFRPWMADRSIVIVDEVKINESKREANKQADELKGICTEEMHMVEPKGVNAYQVRNIFTSLCHLTIQQWIFLKITTQEDTL